LYENYDARHHHTWEVSQSGDGLIQVVEPAGGDALPTLQKPIDMRIERDMVEKLINAYFSEIAPVLPVITQAEFLSNSSPPPILLYSICLVAAARREVPQTVFDAIRYAVNSVIKAEDVLSTASIANVQSLLILCMVGDCHSQFVPNALSALWIRLGTAIRMVRGNGGPLRHQACSLTPNGRLKTWAFIARKRLGRTLKCGADCGVLVLLVTDGKSLFFYL
jgi:Fungal specific transcription factor domain